MSKAIILLSDGTGNSDAKLWRTNVWRLANYIDRSDGDQVVFYESGIGTTSLLSRLFGLAFGIGLPHNVLSLYKFLCQNYVPGDTALFAFGFSRGAYTIRVVLELLLSQGLVPSVSSDAKMNREVAAAYRAYRAQNFHSRLRIEAVVRFVRDVFLRALHGPYRPERNVRVDDIRFIGLWDTVGAYGFPIEGITRGISQLVWPFELFNGDRSEEVRRVCHALSLDDDRTTFHPILWDESGELPLKPDCDGCRLTKNERLTQVWFPGAHSNLGGGNPDDSLAQVSLNWMMKEAAECGLRFKTEPAAVPDALTQTETAKDYDGRIYNPRLEKGSLYRYGPRVLTELYRARQTSTSASVVIRPKIHESVFKRISGQQRYAPISVPGDYEVVCDDGRILSMQESPYEKPERASTRWAAQQVVWNLVWWRRTVYYITALVVIYLLCYPIFYSRSHEVEFFLLPPVANAILLIGSFLPSVATPWVNAYSQGPLWFLGIVAIIYGLKVVGARLESTIADNMLNVWMAHPGRFYQASLPSKWFAQFRGSALYFRVYQLHQRTWPVIFALSSASLFLYISLALISRTVFDIRDANGAFCPKDPFSASLRFVMDDPMSATFSTRELCSPTNMLLERDSRYLIKITQVSPWRDGDIETTMSGFAIGELGEWQQRMRMSALWPLRRVLVRPYFRVIARVGRVGIGNEEFIDPDPDEGRPTTLVGSIRPRQSGQLFLYVNDAVLGLPWLQDAFYYNNDGKASVEIRKLPY